MSAGLDRSTKVKLTAVAAVALVLAVAVGASGAVAVSRALDGDDVLRRPYFPGAFEQPNHDCGDLPRPDREREFRWFGQFGDLEAAAKYLELTEDELREQLRDDGRTLAEIAEAQGKPVAGLVQAMVDEASERLDRAVADGRLTRKRADEIRERLEERITDLVDGESRLRPSFEYPGPGGDFGPPPFAGPRA